MSKSKAISKIQDPCLKYYQIRIKELVKLLKSRELYYRIILKSRFENIKYNQKLNTYG